MKCQVQAASLKRALRELQAVVGKGRSHYPALFCVKVEAREYRLSLTGTNLDQTIRVDVPVIADVSFELGPIMVNFRSLMDLVSGIGNEEFISISPAEVDSGDESIPALELASGYSTSTIAREVSLDDFPLIDLTMPEHTVTLSDEHLQLILRKMVFAVASDDADSVLGGIYLDISKEAFRACATDGKRLTSADIDDFGNPADLTFKVTVPLAAWNILDRCLKDKQRKHASLVMALVAGVGETPEIMLRLPGVTLRSRTIPGNYPKYSEFFPTDFAGVLTFDRRTLLEVLKGAAKLCDKRTNVVMFDPVVDNGEVEQYKVTARTEPGGPGFTAKVACGTNEPGRFADLSWDMNVNYLIDYLAGSDSPTVMFHINGPLKAFVLRDGDSRTKHLLMPALAREDARKEKQRQWDKSPSQATA